MSEEDIIKLIKTDKWMMDVLRSAESLNLPDWWIGAGFIRSKIWDYLHNYTNRTPLPDLDLIYFDKNDFLESEANNFSTVSEDKYQDKLKKKNPGIKWSVTNQARMHIYHNRKPYKNSREAISEWSETATCMGVNLKKGKITLTAPHGTYDLVNLIIRPIPNYHKIYSHHQDLFKNRISKKGWLKKWPKLKILTEE